MFDHLPAFFQASSCHTFPRIPVRKSGAKRKCYSVILTLAVPLRLAIFASAASLAAAQPTVLLDAMSQELNRNFTVLKQKADPPPYFLSYEITEHRISEPLCGPSAPSMAPAPAKTGSWMSPSASARPSSTTIIRVRGDRGQFTSGALISFEDIVDSIKRRIWLETDRAYRAAAQRLIRIRPILRSKSPRRIHSDDFSAEPASVASRLRPSSNSMTHVWQRSRSASSPRASPIIHTC